MKRLEFDTSPSTGRPILLVVLIVASLLVTTLWYREGVGGPIHVLRRGVIAASEPFLIVGTWVSAPFRAVGTWASGASVDRSAYEALQKQNLELKQQLAALQEGKLESDRISALVDFSSAQDLKSVGARVIGRPTDSWGGTVVVDRGTAQGVKIGDPVIAAGGLVGQVVEVSPLASKVRLITDPNSGVSVIVQRTRANGIVRGSLDGGLHLDFVDKAKTPVRGDVLVTSGLGGVYPKGIVMGEVTDVSSPQADLYPEVSVASRVAIDRIEEVLVLLDQQTPASLPGGGE